MNSLAQAILFAKLAHGEQRRKYINEPYINHPVRVMQMVATDPVWGGQDDMATAAVLHDVIEDCDIDDLNPCEWGNNVVRWVRQLTNVYEKAAYPDLNRRARKKLEFERLATIDIKAKVIKMYDRIDNLESFFDPRCDDDEFGKLYCEESWELSMAIADPVLYDINVRLWELAARLQDKVGHV